MLGKPVTYKIQSDATRPAMPARAMAYTPRRGIDPLFSMARPNMKKTRG